MQVQVAGENRAADFGSELSDQAKRLVAAVAQHRLLRDEQWSALSLRHCRSEAEFLDRLLDLMWSRAELNTRDFYIPRRRGVRGRLLAGIKRILWKLLRYQHDQMAFQQNTVNTQLTVALAFIRAEYRLKLFELERRLESLEKAVKNERSH
ncbi:MAG: hypothetical protein ACUVWX_09725 [Kiritimatiellia bacterium]